MNMQITDTYEVKKRYSTLLKLNNNATITFFFMLEFARHGRYELTCYVTIGLILGLIGMAGAIKYARGGGVGKHTGRLVCSTQVFSCKYTHK